MPSGSGILRILMVRISHIRNFGKTIGRRESRDTEENGYSGEKKVCMNFWKCLREKKTETGGGHLFQL